MSGVTGQVDANGCLISADPELLALHVGAGGFLGGKVAIPQIATLARLARTLGILVSRPVIVADGNRTLELLIRAKIEGPIVKLAISTWVEAPLLVQSPEGFAGRDHDFARLEADGAWETDGKLIMIRFSAGIDVDLGTGLGAVLGKPLSGLFTLLPSDDGALPMMNALAHRTPFDHQRAQLLMGHQPLVELSGEPLFDTSGRFAGIRGQLRGDTVQLVGGPDATISAGVGPETNALAERLNSALRKPISRIIANADSIGRQGDGPLRHDYVDYAADIASAGRHLLGLVDDLADLQAIERPDFHVAAEEIDLADIVRRASGLLSVRASDSKVAIDRPDASENLPATGEFRRVLQILVNLIGNAVRYSPPGSKVWIRTEQEGDIATVIVADQGKGIAAKDQERIFEKFERVDSTEAGGSGLGLYVARKLARAMHGDITVDSAPGQGARFALTLPSRA